MKVTLAKLASGLHLPFGLATGEVEKAAGRLKTIDAELGTLELRQDSLNEEKAILREKLADSVSFEQILPDKKYTHLHEQLAENERVHPVRDTEEMVAMRLGGEDDNKRCFARVVRIGRQEDVTAGIFTALVKVPAKNGVLQHHDLPGDIEMIKDAPVETFIPPKEGDDEAVVAVLYTISSANKFYWERGGRPLATGVYEALKEEAQEKGYSLYISTLSPVRDFAKKLSALKEFEGMFEPVEVSGEEQYHATEAMLEYTKTPEGQATMRAKLLQYLMEDTDPVMNFHLGNGAYIGDIKFNPENPQDWAMLNYVYAPDSSVVELNQKLYKDSKVRPVAPHLEEILQRENPILLSQLTSVSPGRSVVPTSYSPVNAIV